MQVASAPRLPGAAVDEGELNLLLPDKETIRMFVQEACRTHISKQSNEIVSHETNEETRNELQMAEELVDPLHSALENVLSMLHNNPEWQFTWVSLSAQRKSAEISSKALEQVMKLRMIGKISQASSDLADDLTFCESFLTHINWIPETIARKVGDSTGRQRRFISIGFGLDTEMKHSYDLDKFSKQIDDLFVWHQNDEVKEKYMAPYFLFVQSSGMGKTKILYEYQKRWMKRSRRTQHKDKNNANLFFA